MTPHDKLAARVAAIEFVLIQTLILVTREVKDYEKIFSILRSSFDERSVRLGDEAGMEALETVDRIFSCVEATLKSSSGNA
ncbi:MAG TPA: hypothetical protein VGH42_11215 [Verrucomicrobiae bacterium]